MTPTEQLLSGLCIIFLLFWFLFWKPNAFETIVSMCKDMVRSGSKGLVGMKGEVGGQEVEIQAERGKRA
jgi:hypothetical protein